MLLINELRVCMGEKEEEEEESVVRELDKCWSCFRHLDVELVLLVSQRKDEQISEQSLRICSWCKV